MANITAARRRALPASKFALPGRRFPIDTAARARNAIARARQFATPAEQRTIIRKVKARFPQIDVEAKAGRTTVKRVARKTVTRKGKKVSLPAKAVRGRRRRR